MTWPRARPDPFLLRSAGVMIRALWLIPLSLIAVGAGLALRTRYRRRASGALTLDHVSGDWLAHARAHEEQEW